MTDWKDIHVILKLKKEHLQISNKNQNSSIKLYIYVILLLLERTFLKNTKE